MVRILALPLAGYKIFGKLLNLLSLFPGLCSGEDRGNIDFRGSL